MGYVHAMRLWRYVRRHGFDTLIVLAAVEAAVEVAVRQDAPEAPETATWFAALLTALVVLPLLLRAAASRSVRPPRSGSTAPPSRSSTGTSWSSPRPLRSRGWRRRSCSGTCATRCGLGSASPSCSSAPATVVYHAPDSDPAELVFIPLLFALGWLGGFALRGRADEAEAAELRAFHAERERDAASRIAVAEERARIARELHDIVAHAVSVMVLQVGAVRHKLPDELDDDRDALKGVELAGRTALAEMRRLLGAMRSDGDELELTPQPGLGGLEALRRRGRPRRASRAAPRGGRGVPATARDRPLGLPDRAGGAHERAQARGRRTGGRNGPLRARRGADRGARRRRRPRGHGRPRARARRGPRAREDLRRRDVRGRGRRWRLRPQRAAPAGGVGREHPRPRRRRPVDGPRRLPHAAVRRGRHRGGRRGVRTGSRRSTRPRASTRRSSSWTSACPSSTGSRRRGASWPPMPRRGS